MSKAIIQIFIAFILVLIVTSLNDGEGFFKSLVDDHPVMLIVFYSVVVAHITIAAMSLSFHRFHTHRGVILSKWIDTPMQIWLWMITSLNRVDWAAVHIFHHAHADKGLDPHSPVQKGLAHVFFLGAWDYNRGKYHPEVLKIKSRIPRNTFESFILRNPILGPTILTSVMLMLFGPVFGIVFSLINFTVSPLFAIGGVNALAHWCGYRNHNTNDNSRNLGYLLPLNYIVCGELDHNNHHAHPRSCCFRNRWFEFDIGYVYLKILSMLRLAEIKYVYEPSNYKKDLSTSR